MKNRYYYLIFLTMNIFSVSEFWHLHDPRIGIVQKSITTYKNLPLAWHFSLWDLAPQKGQKSKVVIIDTQISKKEFSLNNNGKIGSKIKNNKKFFDTIQMSCPYQDLSFWVKNRKGFLKQEKKINSYHGLATIQIIKQIAPNVDIHLYPIFKNSNFTDKQSFADALQKITKSKINIVHLGLKIIDTSSLKEDLLYKIEQSIKKIPYVIAAAGNKYNSKKEAYPAKLMDVVFDVGAYYPCQEKYKICSFSQFEKDVGPKVVAPGAHISYINQDLKMENRSGTSMAAAIVTGFLSLVLTEFEKTFSYQQILTVIYKSAYKLEQNQDWEQKVLLGSIDMRNSLLCFHILKKIKKIISKKEFDKYFKQFTMISFYIMSMYDNKLNSFLEEQFSCLVKKVFFYAKNKELEKCVSLLTDIILSLFGLCKNKYLFDKQTIELVHNSINSSLDYFYKNKNIKVKNRLLFALNRKK